MSAMITTEGASRIFHAGRPDEIRALEEVSLTINTGDAVVLHGPSGSGKSTLLGLLGCMARPTSGRVVVEGREVSRLPERFLTEIRRETFGFIFQQFHLLPGISALENVMLPLYPLPLGFPAIRHRADELLERFGMSARRHVRAGQLSGGEQQRVAIARALINRPRILIADEPTAHLDRQLAIDLLAHLRDLHQEGLTLVIATHDPFILDNPFVSRRIALHDGRLVAAEAS